MTDRENGAMTTDTRRKPPREVAVVNTSYQPSRAELNEDMRVDATFEEAVQALAKPVRIRHISRPKAVRRSS